MFAMSALERALKIAGGTAALARTLGVSDSVVSNWKARDSVPLDSCPGIEAATRIACEELRSDVTWVRDKAGRVTHYMTPVPANSPQAKAAA